MTLTDDDERAIDAAARVLRDVGKRRGLLGLALHVACLDSDPNPVGDLRSWGPRGGSPHRILNFGVVSPDGDSAGAALRRLVER